MRGGRRHSQPASQPRRHKSHATQLQSSVSGCSAAGGERAHGLSSNAPPAAVAAARSCCLLLRGATLRAAATKGVARVAALPTARAGARATAREPPSVACMLPRSVCKQCAVRRLWLRSHATSG